MSASMIVIICQGFVYKIWDTCVSKYMEDVLIWYIESEGPILRVMMPYAYIWN